MSRLGVDSVVQDFRIEKFLGKGSYGCALTSSNGRVGRCASRPPALTAPHAAPQGRVPRQATEGRQSLRDEADQHAEDDPEGARGRRQRGGRCLVPPPSDLSGVGCRLTRARAQPPQIRILASVESPYIIKFNEAFVHNMNLYIITEYAGNGDMFQRLRRLAQKRQMMPEDKAWVFFIQLAIGIQALHRNNILHRCALRALAPLGLDTRAASELTHRARAAPRRSSLQRPQVRERVPVQQEHDQNWRPGRGQAARRHSVRPRICARRFLPVLTHLCHHAPSLLRRAMAKTQIGTPYYVSPELWKNKPYNAKSDIWALGCLLYEMITGKPPFDSNDMRGLARKVSARRTTRAARLTARA